VTVTSGRDTTDRNTRNTQHATFVKAIHIQRKNMAANRKFFNFHFRAENYRITEAMEVNVCTGAS